MKNRDDSIFSETKSHASLFYLWKFDKETKLIYNVSGQDSCKTVCMCQGVGWAGG